MKYSDNKKQERKEVKELICKKARKSFKKEFVKKNKDFNKILRRARRLQKIEIDSEFLNTGTDD